MSQESRRILILTTAFSPFIGGSEIAIADITKNLNDFSFEIVTPRLRPKLPTVEHSNHLTIHRVGIGVELIDKLMFPVLGFLKSGGLIRKFRIKVVHAFQASYGGGAGWLLKVFYPKIKFIVTLQEGKDLMRQNILIRFFRKRIIKLADAVTGISRFLCRFADSINRNSCHLIPNGIDLDEFKLLRVQGLNYRERLGFSKNDIVLITVSRLVPKNGIKDLIEAFSLVKRDNLRLIIVGTGNLESELKDLARTKGVDEKVVFLGSLPREEALKYVATSDIFVRPALSEGLGTAFLEAMVLNVPVIGTPVGGIPDFISDKETGLFCQPSNPESLALAIELILEDQSLRDSIIRNAYSNVAQNYSLEMVANKFRKLYLSFNV